jgi:hypothetical protein
MRGVAPVVAMAVMLAANRGNALDPAGTEIIGLRLGMAEHEVVATLRHQGFAVTHDRGALSARTRDGRLTVDLTEDQAAWQIRYVFTGNGAGEPAKIEAAMLDRFGPPDQAKPMAWCRTIGQDGKCAADGASLIFLPETLTLVLRTGTRATP